MIKYFKPYELVDPNLYGLLGDQVIKLFDHSALQSLDWLRERYGRTTVNNWFWNGSREWSGFRTIESPYYSPTSQHSFGKASDCLFMHVSAEEVREDLRKMKTHPFITRVENNVSWLHFDTKVVNQDEVYFFNP